jgi:hypothetical protein
MKLILAGAVAAAALAAAPPLTHGQLVARADAICVRYDRLLASPPGVDGQIGDVEYDLAWLRLFDRQRLALAALTPPDRDRAAWTRLLRRLPAIRQGFRALTAAIEAGQPVRTWRPLSHRLEAAEREAERAALAVGLKRCFRRPDRSD